MNKQRMMSQSSDIYRMDRKKIVQEAKSSDMGDHFLEANMNPVGPELGKSDLNASKFGSGFRRKQQTIIQQDKERKENEQMLEQRRENRRELRKNFLEQTKFQTRVNIITGENLPEESSKTSKRVYDHHNRDEITKPLAEKRNAQKEQRIANDGLIKKKEYSVKDYFQSYSSYE
ncbi:predicted protein [Naegleria gruberi]|uniref:Predicted protein n=1 Tax=Naegleria gruberi TaxID=5762 RepID=D2VM74_NAEGR|nr:uncharacterized protein NAEGRDRAFT_50704 [Naegleria gruberi]EFC42013.1 predicted protein [Naegleria gruberi]|eukprot:XP_002674757.1 predicted protein [Naegleria gruberi strain NEG-M]